MRSEAQQQAQERQYSALRDIYPLEEKRPVSALRGLLDAIPDQPERCSTDSLRTTIQDFEIVINELTRRNSNPFGKDHRLS